MGKAEAIRAALTGSYGAPVLMRAADALVAVTLAPVCAACGKVLDVPSAGPVCQRCWDEARRSAGAYDGALRHIIHAFKYESRRSLGPALGALLREREAAVLSGADCVVPVPLFPWRRMRRGFNQAAELSRHLGPPVVHALWRIRHTVSQTGLTAAQRRRNMRGAFILSPFARHPARSRRVDGKVIVLVDDVMTTGATVRACVRVLETAGAREVRVVTLARAAPPVRG